MGFLRIYQGLRELDSNLAASNSFYRHVSGAQNIVLFVILVVLAVNWFFALTSLSGKLKLSERGERIFIVVVVLVALLVVLPT